MEKRSATGRHFYRIDQRRKREDVNAGSWANLKWTVYLKALTVFMMVWLPGHHSAMAQADKALRLSALFDSLSAKNRFSGGVLVAENGHVLIEKMYGFSRRNGGETKFEIASLTKLFTALAVMQLKEKGLLSYNDPVDRFISGYPFGKVTLHQLLTHSSGIPDFLGWRYSDLPGVVTNEMILERFRQKRISTLFRPGTAVLYSNSNYIILAAVIEKVSGISYSEYLRKYIFRPAGMHQTEVVSRAREKHNRRQAVSYAWDPTRGRFVAAGELLRYPAKMKQVYGAFGITSTLRDLYRWDRALSSGRLVSESSMKEAFSPKYLDTPAKPVISLDGIIPMAYGWQVLEDRQGAIDVFGTGNFGGFNSLIVRMASAGQTVILLSDCADISDVPEVMNFVAEILGNQPLSELPASPSFPSGKERNAENGMALQGTYTDAGGVMPNIEIETVNGYFYMRSEGFVEQVFFPATDGSLFSLAAPVRLRFEKRPEGMMLFLHHQGRERILIRKK